jgi:hypothetical protein
MMRSNLPDRAANPHPAIERRPASTPRATSPHRLSSHDDASTQHQAPRGNQPDRAIDQHPANKRRLARPQDRRPTVALPNQQRRGHPAPGTAKQAARPSSQPTPHQQTPRRMRPQGWRTTTGFQCKTTREPSIRYRTASCQTERSTHTPQTSAASPAPARATHPNRLSNHDDTDAPHQGLRSQAARPAGQPTPRKQATSHGHAARSPHHNRRPQVRPREPPERASPAPAPPTHRKSEWAHTPRLPRRETLYQTP